MRASFEFKRVDVWSLFRVAFLVYAAIGLMIGLFYWFVLVVAGGIGSAFLEDADIPNLGMLGGVLGIILVPVIAFFYGAMCGLMATIAGALYNLATRFAGGVRFEGDLVEQVSTPLPAPVPPHEPPPAQ